MPKQKSRPEKELTKKQIALSGRQRQQRKRLFIGLGALGGMILIVALVGVYDNLIARPATPVAVVDNVTLRLDQYQARLRYERFLLDILTRQIDAQLANVDTTDASNDFLVQYFQQISAQVMQQRVALPRQVVDDMVEEELARQKAAQEGLTVGEDEVNDVLRARMAQGLGYVTQTQATSVANTAVARTATAELNTPTPLPTATPTLTGTMAATEVATPTMEITPEPTPTLHVITDDEFSKEYADYLKALSEQARVSEAELRDYVRGGLLVTAVRKWFADQTPTEADQVNVSQIQAATDEQAELAMDRLDKGEDFSLVATQVSSNTLTAENGGEMGWFMKGQLESRYSPDVEQAAFSLEAGTYSQPITTTVGWQIIKVNEHGVRALDESQLQIAQTQSYDNWLQQSKESAGVQVLWTSDMAPADPALDPTSTQ